MTDIPVAFIDHVAITAANIERSCSFYKAVLTARYVHDFVLDGVLVARQLRIGEAMLNVHQFGNGVSLVADKPTPGAIDLCFRWMAPIATAIEHLRLHEVEIIEGPCIRTASDGQEGMSVYFRDPDSNLLELLSTVAGR